MEYAGFTIALSPSSIVETAVPEPLLSVPQEKRPVEALYKTVSDSAPVQPETRLLWKNRETRRLDVEA
jgi:hypothetical protein